MRNANELEDLAEAVLERLRELGPERRLRDDYSLPHSYSRRRRFAKRSQTKPAAYGRLTGGWSSFAEADRSLLPNHTARGELMDTTDGDIIDRAIFDVADAADSISEHRRRRCQRKIDCSHMTVIGGNFMQRSTHATPEALSLGWL